MWDEERRDGVARVRSECLSRGLRNDLKAGSSSGGAATGVLHHNNPVLVAPPEVRRCPTKRPFVRLLGI